MTLAEIESRVAVLLDNAEGLLPASELTEMASLARAGEPGIALENFCTQLEEYEVDIPAAMREEIKAIASAMGLPLP